MSAVLPCSSVMLGATSGLRRADATVASSPYLAAGMSSPGAAGGGTKGGEEEEKEEEEEDKDNATLLFVLDRLVGGAATMLSAIVQEQTHFVIRRAFPHLSLCIFLLLL